MLSLSEVVEEVEEVEKREGEGSIGPAVRSGGGGRTRYIPGQGLREAMDGESLLGNQFK